MTYFEDARLKLGSAHDKLILLNEEINKTLNKGTIRYEIEIYPYTEPAITIPDQYPPRPIMAHTYRVYGIPVFSKEFGLMLGEAIQACRISLDYLAWGLVTQNNPRLMEGQKRNVGFPMVMFGKGRGVKAFWNGVERKLPNVPNTQRVIIEKYQPYKRSLEGIIMHYLTTLANTEKHRIIIPVVPFTPEVTIRCFSSDLAVPLPIQEYKPWHIMKDGAKVATIVLYGTHPEVNVEIDLPIVPMFHSSLIIPPPGYTSIRLQHVLNLIYQVCLKVFSELGVTP